ncbi:Exosortase A [Sphingomonas sp. EC-HK361]|uniref:exosortase A n=1 Tax=Sphingomonas sp. EC-HK361 TaxID=2038397 RepID=UPI0012518796|nr:exosortase A [Sphingomonas sp. EC-HK361]VVT03859.1 Exosortase A [Sphingomonas sp. EC-HK361]
MTIAVPSRSFAGTSVRWSRHLVALAIVAIVLLVTFRGDFAGLVDIWWNSTTFGHCLFIAPVIGWLVWTRRRELAQLQPEAWWPGLALVGAGAAAWLAGDAASVALARHLGLVMMLQGAVVTLLGANVARGLMFPLTYALFLVPFGDGMEPWLQGVTVAIVMPLLNAVGVHAYVDGVLIHTGRHVFEVAEACSGAKFVIAMLAYGALVANVCFRSWRRRAIFMGVSFVVPILANGVRAFATIWAAELTSLETATGFDHIVYGWVFFGLVMAAVMAIGWRWFDRAPDDPAFDPEGLRGPVVGRIPVWLAAILVLGTASVAPAWSAVVARQVQPMNGAVALPQIPGWTRAPLSTRAPWTPYYPGADHFLIGRYVDGQGNAVDVAVAFFADQHEGKELIAFGTGVLREEDAWVRVADLPPIAGGAAMRITAPGPVERVVATWYRVGDMVTDDDLAVKFATLKARLLGGDQRAAAVHLSAEAEAGHDPPSAIRRFAAALGPIAPATDAMMRAAR